MESRIRDEQTYLKLLAALVHTVEAGSKVQPPDDERLIHAEDVARKSVMHAASIYTLSCGSYVEPLRLGFFDASSIYVLARALVENFLVFHSVFVEPTTLEEKRFRHLSWIYAGLVTRQRLSPRSPLARQVIADEARKTEVLRERLGELHSNLIAADSPSKLTSKQYDGLVKRGDWRVVSWKVMALRAGWADEYAGEAYQILSGYAHTDIPSVLSIMRCEDRDSQIDLMQLPVFLCRLAMASLVKAYTAVNSAAGLFLAQNPAHEQAVRSWTEVAGTDPTTIPVDWEEVARRDPRFKL